MNKEQIVRILKSVCVLLVMFASAYLIYKVTVYFGQGIASRYPGKSCAEYNRFVSNNLNKEDLKTLVDIQIMYRIPSGALWNKIFINYMRIIYVFGYPILTILAFVLFGLKELADTLDSFPTIEVFEFSNLYEIVYAYGFGFVEAIVVSIIIWVLGKGGLDFFTVFFMFPGHMMICSVITEMVFTVTQISSVVREIIIEKNRKKAIQKRKEERIADERNMCSDDIKYIENILEDCGFLDAGSTSK